MIDKFRRRNDDKRFYIVMIVFMGILACLYGVAVPTLGDIDAHNRAAEFFFTDDFFTSHLVPSHVFVYPLYHLSVRAISYILNITIDNASVFVLALSIIAAVIIYKEIFNTFSDKGKGILGDLICIGAVIFVCARCGLNGWRYYQAQCGANPMHNPTILIMRPFALVSILLYYKFITREEKDRKSYAYLFGFAVFMMLSILAKPNFAVVFLPAMGLQTLFYMIKNKDLLYGIKLLVAVIPSAVLLIYQQKFMTSNTVAFSQFAIKFGSFSEFTPKEVLFVSLVTFPVPILLFNLRYFRENKLYQMSMIALLVGWIQMFFFTNGPSGDFSWGYDMAVQFATFMSLVVAISDEKHKKWFLKILHCGAYVVFAYQVICGIMYWRIVFSTLEYWF